jgi:hypothetical protein
MILGPPIIKQFTSMLGPMPALKTTTVFVTKEDVLKVF